MIIVPRVGAVLDRQLCPGCESNARSRHSRGTALEAGQRPDPRCRQRSPCYHRGKNVRDLSGSAGVTKPKSTSFKVEAGSVRRPRPPLGNLRDHRPRAVPRCNLRQLTVSARYNRSDGIVAAIRRVGRWALVPLLVERPGPYLRAVCCTCHDATMTAALRHHRRRRSRCRLATAATHVGGRPSTCSRSNASMIVRPAKSSSL